jgi:hypothetical protein
MPDVKVVRNCWVSFSQPFVDLLVPVCNESLHREILLLKKLTPTPFASFLFHVVASLNLRALLCQDKFINIMLVKVIYTVNK